MILDAIGGLWLVVGSVVVSLSIRQAYKDKDVKGVNPSIALFFSLLNTYYCFFYFMEGLWWSFGGALGLCITQLVWYGQMIYYLRKRK